MPKRKYSSDSNSSLNKENNDSYSDQIYSNNKTMIQPFKKRFIKYADRKEEQSKALAALSKFLNVSDKYSKAWEKQQQKSMDSKQYHAANKYFQGSLREYQMVGVKWMETLYLSGINGILADEMGLGKTVQVIAFLGMLQTQGVKGMHMIAVPLSTVPNWLSEFERFAPQFPVFKYHGNAKQRDETRKEIMNAALDARTTGIFPVVIIPHHQMSAYVDQFRGMNFIYLIIDEGHRIKNHESQMAISVRRIKCRNKLLLTGTPLQNNMSELWALLNFIMPAIFSNLEVFNQLIQAEDLANETVITSNLKESTTVVQTIQRILEPFMLRRMKKDVLTENLPIKSVQVYCDLSAEQLELYSGALEKDLKRLRGDVEVEAPLDKKERRIRARVVRRFRDEQLLEEPESEEPELPTVMRCVNLNNPVMLYRRIVNHPYLVNAPLIPGTPNIFIDEQLVLQSGKMRVLDALLKRLLERGHKVLIFSTFVIMLDLIEDYLYLRDIPHARLSGNYALEKRSEQISLFNNDPTINVFLVSTRAGGQGINLTSADTVIFFDHDWNPHADLQAQARCHRIGQTKPVMVYHLISRNTIDEYILRTGELKLRLEKAIMLDGKQHNGKKAETMQELLDFLIRKNDRVIHPNGLTFSDKELEALLDRSELLKEMADSKTNAVQPAPESVSTS